MANLLLLFKAQALFWKCGNPRDALVVI